MQKKIILLFLAGILLAGGLYLRHFFSAEQVIKRRILRAARAFEEERILGAVKPFDRAYRDQYGLDFQTLAGQVKSVMDTYDDLDLPITVLSVSLGDAEARVAIRFHLAGDDGRGKAYLMGEPADPCAAILLLEKKHREYVITTTTELSIPGHNDELSRRKQKKKN